MFSPFAISGQRVHDDDDDDDDDDGVIMMVHGSCSNLTHEGSSSGRSVPTERVHGVGVAVLGGIHQRRLAIPITSMHIGVMHA